jgi:FtsP/CotA-like multicopper oxidase with cupredoxin domain
MYKRLVLSVTGGLFFLATVTLFTPFGEMVGATFFHHSDNLNVHPAKDTNPHPRIFETTIVAKEAQVDLDGNGLLANVYTYNGTVPGPEFRVKVGDTVIVHFKNELPEPSSIHWHGIELNNASDGTGVTQNEVMTGETYLYKFIAPRPGVFWYHPHFEPTNPEFKGQYGSFIVEDRRVESKLKWKHVLPKKKHTKTLVLGDTTVCKEEGSNDAETFPGPDANVPWAGGSPYPGLSRFPNPVDLCENPRDNEGNPAGGGALSAGAIPNVQPSQNCGGGAQCRMNEGQLVLTNGLVPAARAGSPTAPGALAAGAQVLKVKSGDGLRLQMISTTVTRYFRLLMTDANGDQVTLYRVGGEGGLLDEVRVEGGTYNPSWDSEYDVGEILLAPSDRADVVLVVPDGNVGDIITLWTRDYERTGRGFADIPTVPVLHLEIVGSKVCHGFWWYCKFFHKQPFMIAEGDPLLTLPKINDPVEKLGPPTAILLDPSTFGTPLPGSADEHISFTNSGTPGPSIDGIVGTFDSGVAMDFENIPHIDSSRYALLDDLLELSVYNETGAHHPFHLHGFSFQPIELREGDSTGTVVRTFSYNEFVDTEDIPGGHTLIYRVRLDDRPMMNGVSPLGGIGRWVFHCHIFHHASFGMISELVVLETVP